MKDFDKKAQETLLKMLEEDPEGFKKNKEVTDKLADAHYTFWLATAAQLLLELSEIDDPKIKLQLVTSHLGAMFCEGFAHSTEEKN